VSLCVEVQPRYREVRPDRWQVECPPQPDELLSSWLWRLALHNGLAPREFADALGLGGGMSWARLDAALPDEHAHVLARHTGQTLETVEKALDRDTYMTPEEARTFGILDEVYSKRPNADGSEKR